mgnify:CR=1 FL=1
MVTVCVAGKFDPIHEGHLDHIMKAATLGDKLIIVTHPDETIQKIKGKVNVPLWARLVLLCGLVQKLNLRATIVTDYFDDDGTITQWLYSNKPDIFAKGGDRTVNNMPPSELQVCREKGIVIIYNVGSLLNSSTHIMGERGKRVHGNK